MTLQEMFDKAVGGIKQQGRLSKDTDPHDKLAVCRYRMPDDPAVRCAVGHLIPDEMYDPAMECRNAEAVLSGFPEVALHLGIREPSDADQTTKMLLQLQFAHDDSDDVGEFLARAASLARQFMLDAKECEVTT